jgi:hypothetical protein
MNLKVLSVKPWTQLRVISRRIDLAEILELYGVELAGLDLGMTVVELCEEYDLDMDDFLDDVEASFSELVGATDLDEDYYDDYDDDDYDDDDLDFEDY